MSTELKYMIGKNRVGPSKPIRSHFLPFPDPNCDASEQMKKIVQEKLIKTLTTMGLEPTIFRFEVGRHIH